MDLTMLKQLDKQNYIPLARRYRPCAFSDLIGQEVLTKTLTNAIIQNKLAGAYLFSGTRGIGKTTSARIIAKIINCTDKKIENNNVKACLACKNCMSMESSNHPDILEIDAASRTSVDDIRLIIESADYKPLLGSFKVFIIDEVHMLSKSAFNALLKTLEEPPAHTIFIFATTELHKIPITILSRCQRFDLRRLKLEEINKILKNISTKENINITDEAIEFLAIKADGSARDAISMLDQSWSLSFNNDGIVDLQLISQMLGSVNLDIIIDFLSKVINNNAEESIKILNEIYISNIDPILFFDSLLNIIGYAIKVKAVKGYKMASYQAYDEAICNITKDLTLSRLTVLWQIFSKSIIELKGSSNMLLASEIATIKAIYSSSLPTPKELVESISKNASPRPDGVNTIKVKASIPSSLPENPNCELHADRQSKDSYPNCEKSKDEPSIQEKKEKITIESLLHYLRKNKEFELYYYLFNEVEIIILEGNLLEISSSNLNKSLNNSLLSLLANWTKDKWNIVIRDMKDHRPLREKLKTKFQKSKEWEMIKAGFSKAEIIDIGL